MAENNTDKHEGMVKMQNFKGNKPLGKPFYVKPLFEDDIDNYSVSEKIAHAYQKSRLCECDECNEQ